MEIKQLLGLVAVGLTFGAYVKYIGEVLKGKTRPHVYTWLIWAILGGIVFALQTSYGAGAGSYVTLAGTVMCALVFLLGLRNGISYITRVDTFFLFMALISLFMWRYADQPVISAILASSAGLIGFAPTVVKSWHKPHSETSVFYLVNSFRFFIAVLALNEYNLVTVFDPVAFGLANGLFGLMLVIRGRNIPKPL